MSGHIFCIKEQKYTVVNLYMWKIQLLTIIIVIKFSNVQKLRICYRTPRMDLDIDIAVVLSYLLPYKVSLRMT